MCNSAPPKLLSSTSTFPSPIRHRPFHHHTRTLLMSPQIKFTSFGIPYLVEFANVKFRSRSRAHKTARPQTPSTVHDYSASGHDTMSIRQGTIASASSETLAYPPDEGDSSNQGLFIQFASQTYRPYHKLSNGRLLRLKHRIANAVLAAGMDSSPSTEKGDPMQIPTLSRISTGSIHSTVAVPGDETGTLFRGTYGQVMTALQSAGLITTPCKEMTTDQATRLGALFIANHTEYGTVEFTKLTLWA